MSYSRVRHGYDLFTIFHLLYSQLNYSVVARAPIKYTFSTIQLHKYILSYFISTLSTIKLQLKKETIYQKMPHSFYKQYFYRFYKPDVYINSKTYVQFVSRRACTCVEAVPAPCILVSSKITSVVKASLLVLKKLQFPVHLNIKPQLLRNLHPHTIQKLPCLCSKKMLFYLEVCPY